MSENNTTSPSKRPASKRPTPATPTAAAKDAEPVTREAFIETYGYDPDDRMVIEIGQTSDPDGSAPVKMGINGRVFVLHRNTPMSVPRAVYTSLKDCVMTLYEDSGRKDDAGNPLYNKRTVQRFPMSVIYQNTPKDWVDPAPNLGTVQ